MNDRLAALLADPSRIVDVPTAELPALVIALAAMQAAAAARLATPVPAPAAPAVRAVGEWLSAGEVAAWLGCAARTVRRRMQDGTWTLGTHWFRQKGSRVRFSRPALEAWLRTAAPSAERVGLAYDVPVGSRHRRRRLHKLHNNGTPPGDDVTTSANAAGATEGVPGAGAPRGAARTR
jgi:hypothetical protein